MTNEVFERDNELIEYIFDNLEKKDLRIEYFDKDFLAFCRYYFPYEFYHPTASFQDEYCYFLQIGSDILFVGFRECSKTVFLRYYYIYCIAYKKKRYIMHYNSDHKKAKSMLLDLSIIMETNKRIIRDFGYLYIPEWWRKQRDPTKKSMEEFITTTGVKVKAMSIWMSPRWETFYSKEWITYRPDLVWMDDIDTIANVKNPRIIDEDTHFILNEVFWWVDAFCQKIFLWNVISEEGRIPMLKKHFEKSNVKLFWIPIRKKWKIAWGRFVATDKEAEEKNKNLTNPREKFISLQKKREDQGSIWFNQNFNLIAYKSGQTIIGKTYIKYWYDRPDKVRTVMGIDPAYSEKTISDPIGITVTHHYTNAEGKKFKYIQDSWKLEWPEKNHENFADFVEEQYKKLWVNIIRIESNNGWWILAKILRARGLAVVEVNQKNDKVQNMLEHQGDFERWEVYFRNDMSSDLENQLLAFPNVDHDDMVDSMNLSFKDDKIWGFTNSVRRK